MATILVTSSEGQGSQGLGFGIASNEASRTVKHLLDPSSDPLGWIGVRLQDVTPALKSAFHLQHPGGFLVTGMDPGSPAAQAGLLSGDVITRIGDSRSANSSDLIMDIIQTPLGTRVPVAFERHGKAMQAEVTVARWIQLDRGEAELMHTMAEAQAAETPELGVILAPITDLARGLYKISADNGVVVAAVEPGSDAFTQGIIPGDVVEKVQNQVVTSPDEAMTAAKQAMARDRFIALLVAGKNGSTRWVPIYSGHRPSGEGSRELVSSGGEPKQTGETQAGATVQGQKH